MNLYAAVKRNEGSVSLIAPENGEVKVDAILRCTQSTVCWSIFETTMRYVKAKAIYKDIQENRRLAVFPAILVCRMYNASVTPFSSSTILFGPEMCHPMISGNKLKMGIYS